LGEITMTRPTTKKAKERKKETKKKTKSNREKLQAAIPGVMYKGTGEPSPAMRELLKKLKKGGADSLDSSGMGTRWKV